MFGGGALGERVWAGVAGGGNKIFGEIEGCWEVLDRTCRFSVFSLRLFSAARDDKMASVGAFVGK